MSEIIFYDRFLECERFTLDSYWKKIFNNCAKGKFPKYTRYNHEESVIVYKNENNNNIIVNLPDNPEKLYNVLIDIFREKLGLFSPLDFHFKKEEIEALKDGESVDLDCEWKKIKPKFIKDDLIMNYILKMKDEYDLSYSQAKKIFITINLGIQSKKITSDDFDFRDREIKNINGVVFNPRTKKVVITNKSKKSSGSSEKNNSGVNRKFTSSIEKYLKDYRKTKEYILDF